jgi:hypothetical protein
MLLYRITEGIRRTATIANSHFRAGRIEYAFMFSLQALSSAVKAPDN